MNNIERILTPDYPADVEKIRKEVPVCFAMRPFEIEALWRAFGEGWLDVSEENLSSFLEWIQK